MSKSLSLLLTLSLAAVLVVAGCGSEDESLTKAEFIKQADAICLKGERKKQTDIEDFLLKAKLGTGETFDPAQEKEMSAEVIAPPIRTATDEVSELSAPEGEEEKVEAVLASADKGLQEFEDPPNGKIPGDAFDEAAKLARDYGFKVCYVGY